MKVVILAGGTGTRLAEETEVRPKPLVEIGSEPILWHVMKGYAHAGFRDFVLALGYKGELIKQFFIDRRRLSGSFRLDLATGTKTQLETPAEDWHVYLVDTGRDTNTGGRLFRLRKYLGGETFLVTYGDGVSDVDVRDVVAFHRKQGRLATITAVRPPARFGEIVFDGDMVATFTEKPQVGGGWINGGFMVFEAAALDYMDDNCSLEYEVLARLSRAGQLAAYRHEGFWQCMDTLRDKILLNRLWAAGTAPWRIWD